MVVGQRGKLHQNLADDTGPWLYHIPSGQIIELADDTADITVEFCHGRTAL